MRTLAYPIYHLLPSRFVFVAITLFMGAAAAEAISAADPPLATDPSHQPPASNQLAFVRDDQIYLLNADGTGLIQLTNTKDGVANGYPAWSSDGQRLAFARSNSEGISWDILVMNADGSNVIQLTHGGNNVEPSWAPDGHTIVFTSYPAGSSSGLSVIDVDAAGNSDSMVLLDFLGFEGNPAWSPDGQTITFTSDFFQAYDFTFDLGAINADGSNVRPLIEGPFLYAPLTYYFQSAWSPDGRRLGLVVCPYAADNCYPESAIAVANSDGSGLRTITQAGGFAKPTWSPDGRWIAYGATSCRSCPSSVRYVQVDGGAEGVIVDNGHSPAWRPEIGARINTGHSGAWFNPDTAGQGILIDIDPEDQFIFLSWFTFTTADSEHPDEQHWFTAQGNYVDNQAVLTLYETLGGKFDDPQEVQTMPVGELTVEFSDCSNGTVSYSVDSWGEQGSFPIMRGIPGSEVICEEKSQSEVEVVDTNPGMNGAWYDLQTEGQGFLFEIYPDPVSGNFMFVAWFTFGEDTASGQRWLTAQGGFEGPTAEIEVYETIGGRFDDPQVVDTTRIGTMSIEFGDCNNAVVNYSLDDDGIDGEINITQALPKQMDLCQNQ